MTAQRLSLAVLALSVGLTAPGALAPAVALPATQPTPSPSSSATTTPSASATEAAPAPAVADLLDVTFEEGTPADAAKGRTAEASGDPEILVDGGLARRVADFDGDDAYSYALNDADYDQLVDGFTVECSFKRDATPTSGEDTLCGNKEAGGFAMVVKDGRAGFMVHVNGSYSFAWADVEAERWYHAAGVFDGETVRLYLDGELAAEAKASGTMTVPPKASAHHMVVGADSGPGQPGQHAIALIDTARLYSQPVSAEQMKALHAEFSAQPDTPRADVFDVDFADGTSTERVQDLPVTVHGEPAIAEDPVLGRNTATFDGDDALLYPIGEQYSRLGDSMTVECVFRYNGPLPTSGETNLCANKEAGGFSMTMYGSKLTFAVNTGSYHNAGVEIEPNQWYHAVGVFDGESKTVKLYVNGILAAEAPTANSAVKWPPNALAHNMVIGADASNGSSQFHANATIASARIFSTALDAQQAAALNAASLQEARKQSLELVSTTPAAGSTLTRATPLKVEWNTPELVAQGTVYAIDGEPVKPGEKVGAGLRAGEHTLTVTGTTVFGTPINESVTFTSGNIPVDGGTETGQGQGTVTLSARATHPDDGEVTHTFRAGQAALAEGGFQGLVEQTPTTLEFEHTQAAELTGKGESLSAAPGQIAFQRFDVKVEKAAEGQSVRWSGTVDPTRQVNLAVWNPVTDSWEQLADGRGVDGGDLVLSAPVRAEHVVDGSIRVLVTGEDPFADDLENPVRDAFEDPADYDFSIAHLTDTQYLSEGAREDAYSAEQRAIWADAYTSINQWIVDNAKDRKIAYVAHTGDIVENWHAARYANEAEMAEIAQEEFEFASEAQKILDDAQIPNGVTPGNHDNRTGTHNGPEAMYNQYFGPERYEALEQTQGWKDAQATYTPYAEGDNDNHYDLFSAGGLDFVAVYLGYDVTQEEIDWAHGVLQQYSDRNAMVMTHAHRKPSVSPDARGAAFSHDGARIDQGVLKRNDNVFLVLSGHEHGVDIEVRKDVGTQGNNVVELLADYQFYKVSAEELGMTGIDGRSAQEVMQFGSSFFRMLQIDVDSSEMAVDTYSPLLENFGATEYDDRNRYDGTEDDTRLPIQLETRKTSFSTGQVVVTTPTDEVIGETTVRSGWPGEVVWKGLTEGQTYAWYVTSRDARSGAELPVGETGQMGVFTATARGTDAEAPVLTVPAAATIQVGDTFDPMAGVRAQDNTDGDLADHIQVLGTVDTSAVGTYTLTYVVEDANGNQAIASRAITVAPAPAAPDFADNPRGSQYYQAVRWMQLAQITTGYSDNTYRKHRDINRGESVAFIYRYVDPQEADAASDFSDVGQDHAFYAPISWAQAQGVTTGYADGLFRPGKKVTRGEFASFLYRGVGAEYTGGLDSFRDVSPKSAHARAIAWLAAEGLSTGYGNGTFRPADPISRGEVAALMHRYERQMADQD